ncbi:MAG TPA: GAF domain-containing protein [Candidatus Baltobacteraceae bacterium]|jgi:hypothetical protein
MPSWFGRGLMFVIVVASVLFVCGSGFIGEAPGYYGSLPVAALSNDSFRLGDVPKGTSLAEAGLHPGEMVRFARSDLETRAALLTAVVGSRLTLIAGGREVTLVAHAGPKQFLPLVLIAVKLAYLLVAGLLVLRRWETASVRALVFFLTGFGLALGLPNVNPIVSSEFSFALFDVGAMLLLVCAGAAAAEFSAHLSDSPTLAERRLASAAVVTAGMGVVAAVAVQLFFAVQGVAARVLISVLFALPFLLAIATLVVGFIQARAADRSRRLWVLLIIGVGISGPALDFIVIAFAGYTARVDQFALLTVAIIPVGLAYVILRHRLIDVGFVLNQAAVYAGVSIVIVGILVIVETLLSNYVASASHVTNTAVQLGVALALGFSINAIHKRVERFVDRVFFRVRYAAQAALHAFALDAPYVTDVSLLLERCVQSVHQYARATRAGTWVAGPPGEYTMAAGDFPAGGHVDFNDPAAVAMRARHVVVDLQKSGSSIPGVLAFPMVSGGELLGILVCDAKADQESYAPDERASLEEVASAVAHALGALRIQDLEREVAALRAIAAGPRKWAVGGGAES